MLQKIFLHVGVEKTGTTTLQLTMAINRRLLQQHGFAYPIAPGEFNHIGLTLCAANPEAVPDLRQTAGVLDGQAYDAFLRRYPAQLREELARSGCHTAMLSSEHCSSRLSTVAEVAKLYHVIAPFARECRAIVYLRRQDELVASRYSTAVKSGATDEFHFPQEIGSLDYLRLLNMWAEVFGEDNISVRVFEPQQMKHGDLISDFFETVGYMQHVDILRPEDQNRSLDVHTVEFLRRFNTRVPIFTMNRANPDRGYIEQALAGITTRECLRPSAEAATAFLNRFTESNAEVARRFLNRGDGVLFTSAPPHDQQARLPTLDLDKAVTIAAALWRWQETRLSAIQTERSRRAAEGSLARLKRHLRRVSAVNGYSAGLS